MGAVRGQRGLGREYMNKISNKTRQLWPACKLQNENQVGCPCSKLSNEHQITMQLGCICFSSSPCATKRHTSDGLHLQTQHLVSMEEGYVKMEQSQEEGFFTAWCQSSVSPGQFPLQQTSEVKMLSVCQLHHTLIISSYSIYHVKPLAFKHFCAFEMCGYHLSQ